MSPRCLAWPNRPSLHRGWNPSRKRCSVPGTTTRVSAVPSHGPLAVIRFAPHARPRRTSSPSQTSRPNHHASLAASPPASPLAHPSTSNARRLHPAPSIPRTSCAGLHRVRDPRPASESAQQVAVPAPSAGKTVQTAGGEASGGATPTACRHSRRRVWRTTHGETCIGSTAGASRSRTMTTGRTRTTTTKARSTSRASSSRPSGSIPSRASANTSTRLCGTGRARSPLAAGRTTTRRRAATDTTSS